MWSVFSYYCKHQIIIIIIIIIINIIIIIIIVVVVIVIIISLHAVDPSYNSCSISNFTLPPSVSSSSTL